MRHVMKGRTAMSETISQLLNRRRWCYWIPADGYGIHRKQKEVL